MELRWAVAAGLGFVGVKEDDERRGKVDFQVKLMKQAEGCVVAEATPSQAYTLNSTPSPSMAPRVRSAAQQSAPNLLGGGRGLP